MNAYNGDSLPIHNFTEHTRVSLTLLDGGFLEEHPTMPKIPPSTSLPESIHRTLQQDDFTPHVPATSRKPHVNGLIQVRLNIRLRNV